MAAEGRYIYCIVGTRQERSFGPIGIGGRGDEVVTLGDGYLCMVVSNSPITKYAVSREHLIAHQRVIEEVMREFTVLPVRFGTIATNADCIRNFLERKKAEFKHLLSAMEHKVELGVKAVWKDMSMIFKEIVDEDRDVKALKEVIDKNGDKENMMARIEIGRLVEQALKRKNEHEAETIMSSLRMSAFDYRINRTTSDRMFLNASFLVSSGREKEFDNIMEDMSDSYRGRTMFKYAGPLPPFNFVNIAIHPEEWEQ